jgi:phosphatidylinositol glycan class B
LLGEKTRRLAEKRQWPDYIVFFEQLQSIMGDVLEGSGYMECWRRFNTHWHDDWRRKGDVIVWCLKES